MEDPVVFAISCGLYLRGDELVPEEVSSFLGLAPTRAFRKGDVAEGTNKYPRRTGLWSRVVSDTSSEFGQAVSLALDEIGGAAQLVQNAPCVTSSEFDIFATADVSFDDAKCSFVISAQNLQRLARLNVPVQITVTFSPTREDEDAPQTRPPDALR